MNFPRFVTSTLWVDLIADVVQQLPFRSDQLWAAITIHTARKQEAYSCLTTGTGRACLGSEAN